MADQGLLARMMAGLIGPGAKPQPNFAPSPSPFSVPFTGLRNEPAPQLPPFEQPGQQLAQFQPPIPSASRQAGYAPPPAPAPMPQPQQQMPQQWLALNDQSRTAAFDPTRDAKDPNNVTWSMSSAACCPRWDRMAPCPAAGARSECPC
jgi:hypothetical protein